MFRCESYYFLIILIVLNSYIALNLFNYTITGVTYIHDIIYRVNLNDSPLNSFSFYWTSLYYLPFFFISIFYNNLIYAQISNMRLMLLFIPIIIHVYYSFEFMDSFLLNFSYSNNHVAYSSVNELLLNTLNKYHPFIFYLSAIYLVSSCLLLVNIFFINNLFSVNKLFTYEIYLVRITLLVNLLALFLGSWWAIQESTWGGWWNWDASEVFGLLVCFYNLIRIHSLQSINNNYLLLNKYVLWICFFIFSYVIIQLNFTLVAHNFGIEILPIFESNIFFSNLLLMTYLLPPLIYFYYWRFTINTLLVVNYIYYYTKLNTWLVYIYYIIIVFMFIINSYSLLLEEWLFINLEYIKSSINYPYLVVVIILLSIILVPSKDFIIYLILLLLALLTGNSVINTLVLLVLFKVCSVRLLHNWLIIFLIINLESNYASYILEDFHSILVDKVENVTIFYTDQPTYVCDSFFIQRVVYYTTSNSYFSSFSNYYNSSLYNLNHYVLLGDLSSFINFYFRVYDFIMLYFIVKDLFITNLVDLLIMVCLLSGVMYFSILFFKNYY